MSTHMPGFQSFLKSFFALLVLAKLATSSIRVKISVNNLNPPHSAMCGVSWVTDTEGITWYDLITSYAETISPCTPSGEKNVNNICISR